MKILSSITSFYRVWIVNLIKGITIDSKTTICKNTIIKAQTNANIIIKNSTIDHGVKIIAGENASIQISDSYIGSNSVIVARESIIISSNCQVAEMVVIRDQSHKFGNLQMTIKEQGFDASPIFIDENVWIGAKATILKGSTIGKNTVIGAHSLVNNTLDENSLYVGSPVRKVRRIGTNE